MGPIRNGRGPLTSKAIAGALTTVALFRVRHFVCMKGIPIVVRDNRVCKRGSGALHWRSGDDMNCSGLDLHSGDTLAMTFQRFA